MSAKPFKRLQNVGSGSGAKRSAGRGPAAPLGPGRPTLSVEPPTEFDCPDGVPCPGFDQLSPPTGVDPKVFQPDKAIDRVVLAMALASNDLLSARWVLHQMNLGKPKTSRLNGYDGARGGMILWCNRLMLGVLHEVLRLLKEHRQLLSTDPEFAMALQEMNAAGRENWGRMFRVATEAPLPNEAKFLAQIRGNLSFHYYQPEPLADGYRDGFFGEPTESNEYAYMSLGPEFPMLRFYFADLAVRTAGQSIAQRTTLQENGYESIFDDVSNMLYAVVVGFIRMRLDQLESKDVS